MNRFLGFVLVGLVAVVLLGGQFRPAGVTGDVLEPRPAVGYPAPDFELPGLDGNPIRLSDYRGKVVFINFWATWCGPCDEEMPEIARLRAKYDPEEVVVIGIDLLHTEDSPEAVAQYMADGGYDWPVAMDTGEVTVAYNAVRIPSSFFIDRDGIIRAKYDQGPMTLPMMEDLLKRALRGA